MPSVSKDQQQAMGAAYAAKKGTMPPSKLWGAAKEMYKSMSKDQLKDFAETKHKGLPEKKAFLECPLIIKQAMRGKGLGVGGVRQLDLGADKCKCPSCGHTVSHTKGTPCMTLKCPKCGSKMMGV